MCLPQPDEFYRTRRSRVMALSGISTKKMAPPEGSKGEAIAGR